MRRSVPFLRTQRECETYAGEEQSAQWGINDVQDPMADEDAQDGEEQQHDQANKQHAPTGSEVIFALWRQDVRKHEAT